MINLGGGLFHLFGKGDAFGAGLTRGRHQAGCGRHDQRIGRAGPAIGAPHISGHDKQQGWHGNAHRTARQYEGVQRHQRRHTIKAEDYASGRTDPHGRGHKSAHDHPAATTLCQLEIFRCLLPGQQIPARGPSFGIFAHTTLIPRHSFWRETRMLNSSGPCQNVS